MKRPALYIWLSVATVFLMGAGLSGGGGGGIAALLSDTSPQLGGDLDTNASAIVDTNNNQVEIEDDICVDDDGDSTCEVVTAAGVMSLDPDDDGDKQIVLTTSSGAGNIQVCNTAGTCSMNILSGISSTDQVKSTAGDLWIYSTPTNGDIRLLASGTGGTVQVDAATGIYLDANNDGTDELYIFDNGTRPELYFGGNAGVALDLTGDGTEDVIWNESSNTGFSFYAPNGAGTVFDTTSTATEMGHGTADNLSCDSGGCDIETGNQVRMDITDTAVAFSVPHSYYGSMYEAAGTDAPDVASAGQNVWVELEPDTTGLVYGFSYATGDLTVTNAGTYMVTFGASFSGGGNETYEMSVSVDDVIQAPCTFSRKLGAGGDVDRAAGNCILSLSASDVLKMEVRSKEVAPSNPTFTYATISAFQL